MSLNIFRKSGDAEPLVFTPWGTFTGYEQAFAKANSMYESEVEKSKDAKKYADYTNNFTSLMMYLSKAKEPQKVLDAFTLLSASDNTIENTDDFTLTTPNNKDSVTVVFTTTDNYKVTAKFEKVDEPVGTHDISAKLWTGVLSNMVYGDNRLTRQPKKSVVVTSMYTDFITKFDEED